MWFTLTVLGVEILSVGVGLHPAGADGETHYVSNSGGSFELAEETEAEWEPSEEYDPDYDNRARFGFRP